MELISHNMKTTQEHTGVIHDTHTELTISCNLKKSRTLVSQLATLFFRRSAP